MAEGASDELAPCRFYVDWIEGAKKVETRVSRIEKALGMLAEGKRLK